MQTQTEARKIIRKQRANLSEHARNVASTNITNNIHDLGLITRHQRFACYLAYGGEVDTSALIEMIWRKNKTCYLPSLHWNKQNKLLFMPFNPDTVLLSNRYGILEPKRNPHTTQPAWAIDVIFVPLVGFDTQGNRIGMGGGYYDRTFNFLLSRKTWLKPKLIGLAYDFQRLAHIQPQAWDVPLNYIITETRSYKI